MYLLILREYFTDFCDCYFWLLLFCIYSIEIICRVISIVLFSTSHFSKTVNEINILPTFCPFVVFHINEVNAYLLTDIRFIEVRDTFLRMCLKSFYSFCGNVPLYCCVNWPRLNIYFSLFFIWKKYSICFVFCFFVLELLVAPILYFHRNKMSSCINIPFLDVVLFQNCKLVYSFAHFPINRENT